MEHKEAIIANKKPYERPVLQTFGSFAELTKTVAPNNNSDGAGNQGSKSRTS